MIRCFCGQKHRDNREQAAVHAPRPVTLVDKYSAPVAEVKDVQIIQPQVQEEMFDVVETKIVEPDQKVTVTYRGREYQGTRVDGGVEITLKSGKTRIVKE